MPPRARHCGGCTFRRPPRSPRTSTSPSSPAGMRSPARRSSWPPSPAPHTTTATTAAAFLAAEKDRRIQHRHFLLAVEREFDKAGRAHPGFPPHYRWQPEESTQAAGTEPPPEKISLVAG